MWRVELHWPGVDVVRVAARLSVAEPQRLEECFISRGPVSSASLPHL